MIEKALKLSKRLHRDKDSLQEWLSAVDEELKNLEANKGSTLFEKRRAVQVSSFNEFTCNPISRCFMKRIAVDSEKWSVKMKSIKENFNDFTKLCDPGWLENLKDNILDSSKDLERLHYRLHKMLTNLKVQDWHLCLEQQRKNLNLFSRFIYYCESVLQYLDISKDLDNTLQVSIFGTFCYFLRLYFC